MSETLSHAWADRHAGFVIREYRRFVRDDGSSFIMRRSVDRWGLAGEWSCIADDRRGGQ